MLHGTVNTKHKQHANCTFTGQVTTLFSNCNSNLWTEHTFKEALTFLTQIKTVDLTHFQTGQNWIMDYYKLDYEGFS